MLARAEKRVQDAACRVTLEQTGAEVLPFDNQTFDTAVGTLVFCTIPDVQQALLEIKRVLKSGGRFLLVEHVRSAHPVIANIQEAIAPVWKWCCGGCHLNRDTLEAIRASGYNITDMQWHDRYHIFIEITATVDN